MLVKYCLNLICIMILEGCKRFDVQVLIGFVVLFGYNLRSCVLEISMFLKLNNGIVIQLSGILVVFNEFFLMVGVIL